MKIISASFFWQNDKPNGLGITFGPPGFDPDELTAMFDGPEVKKYFRDSDFAMGDGQLVKEYLAQLESLAKRKQAGEQLTINQAILAALNIMWLSSRGFIPNDNFNGIQFTKEV